MQPLSSLPFKRGWRTVRTAARAVCPPFYDFCWDQKERVRCVLFRRLNGNRISDISDFDYQQPSQSWSPLSPRPRVVLVCDGNIPVPPDGWGAVQRVVWNLHQALQRHGFESLISNSTSGEVVLGQLQEFKPDLINVHTDGSDHITKLLPYVMAAPLPIVSTMHHSGLSVGIPTSSALNARLADVILALNPSIKERFLRAGYKNVHFIPNGVNLSVFKPRQKIPNTVIAVGQNIPRKKFAETARFFLDQPEYHLTLCGPNMDRVGKGIPVIPTGPNITVLGNQVESEIARLMGESEYLVHLGDIESFCLVVREAMASGCKVWTKPNNAQDVTNVAFSWEAAVNDRDLGVRAANEAVERLGWDRVAKKTAELFRLTLRAWSERSR